VAFRDRRYGGRAPDHAWAGVVGQGKPDAGWTRGEWSLCASSPNTAHKAAGASWHPAFPARPHFRVAPNRSV